jgi:transposase
LIDESGLLMAPLVRRTWAWRGQRPELKQKGEHRQKVSLAAALWLPPQRDRLELFFETIINGYFNNEQIADFLEDLVRAIPNRLVVVWDRGSMHRGDPIWSQLARFEPRLSLEELPPYAPMLNPLEPVFSWLKYSRLCNFAPWDADELNRVVFRELQVLAANQSLLQNLWHRSDLPMPRPLC